MKTLIHTAALTVTLSVIYTTNIFAATIFGEELNNDDMPTNTTEIYNDILLDKAIAKFNFTDESYINDIPFDTECISEACLYQEAVSVIYIIEDEEYIDDIPFNTRCVSAKCRYDKAMKVEFNFEEEEYIDDMEMNTK